MTDLRVVPRGGYQDPVWNGFADECADAWIWHRAEILDASATWPGRDDVSFAVERAAEPGRPCAIVPLQVVRQYAGSVIPAHLLQSTGGPAFSAALNAAERCRAIGLIRDHLDRTARSRGAVETGITLAALAPSRRSGPSTGADLLELLGCGLSPGHAWTVDLRVSGDELWRRMQGRARTAVRKAEKNAVTVRPADREGDLDAYYRLHCETYSRTGVHPHPRAYFERIWKVLLPRGLARVLIAEHEGLPVAAANFAVYKSAAVYWTGASSSDGLSLGANALLQWKAMAWMRCNGVEWYETGEAFPDAVDGKLKGLNDFKKSFGGSLRPFCRGTVRADTARGKAVRLLRRLKRVMT